MSEQIRQSTVVVGVEGTAALVHAQQAAVVAGVEGVGGVVTAQQATVVAALESPWEPRHFVADYPVTEDVDNFTLVVLIPTTGVGDGLRYWSWTTRAPAESMAVVTGPGGQVHLDVRGQACGHVDVDVGTATPNSAALVVWRRAGNTVEVRAWFGPLGAPPTAAPLATGAWPEGTATLPVGGVEFGGAAHPGGLWYQGALAHALWFDRVIDEGDLVTLQSWASSVAGWGGTTKISQVVFEALVVPPNAEEEGLYSRLRRHIPAERVVPAEPLLRAMARVLYTVRGAMRRTAAQSDRLSAQGRWLTLLAWGLGVQRAAGESDDSLRARMADLTTKVTRPNVEAVLGALVPGDPPDFDLWEWFERPMCLLDAGEEDLVHGTFLGVSRFPVQGGFIVRLPDTLTEAELTLIAQIVNDVKAFGVPWRIILEPYWP